MNLAHALAHRRATALGEKYGDDFQHFRPSGADRRSPPPDDVAALDEAIAIYRRVLDRKPPRVVAATALHGIGTCFTSKGDNARAAEALRGALALEPAAARTHEMLGFIHLERGKARDAIREFEEAMRLDPEVAAAPLGLGDAWTVLRDHKKASASYRKAAARTYRPADAWGKLGLALLAQGEREEGVKALRESLAIDPDGVPALVNLGIALLQQHRHEQALVWLRRAHRLQPEHPVVLINLGRALVEGRAIDEAIPLFRKAAEVKPDFALAHVVLGTALAMKGQFTEGLEALRRGRKLAGADLMMVMPTSEMIRDVEKLQRLDAKLQGVLGGAAKPADAAEAIALAKLCQAYKRQYRAAARMYAESFALKPALADDLKTWDRYNAACVAALAGCGKGEDAAGLGAEERGRLRGQALGWLRADLAAWEKLLDGGRPADVKEVREKMRHWQKDADLAGVRDKDALQRLPEAEREPWQKLWTDVAELQAKAQGKE